MSSLIKRIMAEYDEVKGDGHFDEGHPVFQMAEQIDMLHKHMRKTQCVLNPSNTVYSENGEAWCIVDPEELHELLSGINEYWIWLEGEDG